MGIATFAYNRPMFEDGQVLTADDMNDIAESIRRLNYPLPVTDEGSLPKIWISDSAFAHGFELGYDNEYDPDTGGVLNYEIAIFRSMADMTNGTDDTKVVLRGIEPGIEDHDAVTVAQLNTTVGDIESALDSIIAMQNAMIESAQNAMIGGDDA